MGQEVNKITADQWNQWIKEADEHTDNTDKSKGDGIMNINSAFETTYVREMAKLHGADETEINAFFDGYNKEHPISDEVSLNNVSKSKPQEAPSVTNYKKEKQAYMLNMIANTELKGSDFSALAQSIIQQVNDPGISYTDRVAYNNLANQVKTVTDAVQAEQGKTTDVAQLFKNVEKTLKASKDELLDFRLDVLDKLEAKAIQNKKANELQDIENEYKELRTAYPKENAIYQVFERFSNVEGFKDLAQKWNNEEKSDDEVIAELSKNEQAKAYYDKLTTSLTREEAIKSIKKDARFKDNGNLISQLEKGAVMEDARKEVWDAEWKQRTNENATKSRLVEKYAKESDG